MKQWLYHLHAVLSMHIIAHTYTLQMYMCTMYTVHILYVYVHTQTHMIVHVQYVQLYIYILYIVMCYVACNVL